MSEPGTISVLDDKQYRSLKRLYQKAVDNKEKQFTFENNELLTTFAKYLLMHIENIRKARGLPLYKVVVKKND